MSNPFFDTIPGNTTSGVTVTFAGSPSASGSRSGFVNSAADQDWFRISLRAGELYQFQANAAGALDPTLALRNSIGTQLSFNDDGGPGLNSLITFRPTTAGLYFLDVGGFSTSTGGYSVVAREVPASTATYSSIAVNGSTQGDIQDSLDQDWHRIALTAGQSYIFDADGLTLGDPTLALRNSVGTQLAFNDDGGPGLDSRIEFTAAASGTFYLDVGGFGAGTGRYNLLARIDDAADDINGLDSIAVGGARSGRINSGTDQDFYRIALVAGQSYIFDADGLTLADPTLALRNSIGTQLAFNDDGGPGLDSRIEFTAAASGTFYLDVGSFGAGTGTYNLLARVDDAADDINTLDSITVGGSRAGRINSGTDQDFYRVSLTAGQSYIFDADGVTLADPTLALRNSAGTQLAFNDDGGPGLDSRIEFTAAASGTFYLDVGSFGAGTGTYNLLARVDDAANDINTTDSIAVNGSRSGTINIGTDQDFFRIALAAGQSYIFDVDGGTLADPTLALRNSAGAQLAFNDDGGPGLDARIEFTAAAAGNYYLDVGSFGAGTGSYTLLARIDDVANDINTTDAILANGFRSGTVNSATDQDFFRVSLTGGQFYTFDAVGVGLSDPTLGVRNAAGTQIAFDDDSGAGLNSHINFTAPANGTYYLDVGGFGASTGSYNLFA